MKFPTKEELQEQIDNGQTCQTCNNKPQLVKRMNVWMIIKCKKCVDKDEQETYGEEHYCDGCKLTHKDTEWQIRTGDIKCSKWFKSKPHEWTTEAIKEGRKQYKNELYQPYREGKFSKEFKDANPEVSKDMVKQGVITQKQHDKAKKVWYDDDVL